MLGMGILAVRTGMGNPAWGILLDASVYLG